MSTTTEKSQDKSIMDYYLDEITNIAPLDPKVEASLYKSIEMGDQKAADKLVSAYLGFVVSIAKKYQNCGILLEDLIESGNEGLVWAVKKFDYTKGNAFSTYAAFWIKEKIIESIRETGRAIRIPRPVLSEINAIKKFQKKYEQENEMLPSVDEIAEALGYDEQTVADILSADTSVHSLDCCLSEEGEFSYYDIVPQSLYEETDYVPQNETKEVLLKMAIDGTLKERDAKILCEYHGIGCKPKSAQAISEELGLTRACIHLIIKKSEKKLRISRYSNELRMCC